MFAMANGTFLQILRQQLKKQRTTTNSISYFFANHIKNDWWPVYVRAVVSCVIPLFSHLIPLNNNNDAMTTSQRCLWKFASTTTSSVREASLSFLLSLNSTSRSLKEEFTFKNRNLFPLYHFEKNR
jgi:hypothetical protein